ncbi:hypothetical protein D9611_009316 [Ephemerocybe angulata]|uniref:CCHC-type domain-containing protein n=1 Tax=Ephemerocybe angulata TaxID=980116 RepID=A0A8H5BJ50_9AGAR|nr:hypothetical protein D9611_009316 [Tulosesus angulatus]
MADSTSEPRAITFPPLNDDNYHYWTLRMEAELVRRGLYGHVIRGWLDDGVEWMEAMKEEDPQGWSARLVQWERKRMAKKRLDARAEIIARLSDSQLDHVLMLKDPVDIWEALQKVHVSRGLASRLSLRREFLKLAKKDDEAMSGFIGRVRKLAYQLKAIGVDVTDEDMILAATVGLGESWNGLVMTLDSTPAGELTFEYVVGRLLNEESKRRSEAPVKGAAAKEKKDTLALEGRSGATQTKEAYLAKGGVRACWQCGEEGHIKAFCKAECTDKGKQEENGRDARALIAYGRAGGAGTDVSKLVDLGERQVGVLY